MKLKAFNTLRRLMKQTESDNEHERLTAITMANAMLAKEGLTWDRFFDRAVRLEVESMPAPAAGRKVTDLDSLDRRVLEALENIEESDPRAGLATFAADMRSKLERFGSLRPDDRERVFQAEARCAQGGYR